MSADDDLERRLRAALVLRAAEITPDPRTWQRVADRAERVRRRAHVLVSAATAAVLLVVGGVVYDAVRPRVEFPAGDARPDQSEIAAPTPGPGPCGEADLVLVLRTATGALDGACADGTVADLTAGSGPADAPALSADGALLAFSRPARAGAEVVVRDLRTGAERVLGPGGQPAFAPDGRIARVSAGEPGGARIVVTTAAGEELAAFPAGGGTPAAQVVDLAWMPDGGLLSYGVVGDGGDRRTDVVADPATGAVDPLMAHQDALGGEHAGSWPLGRAQLVTVARCCPAADEVESAALAVAGYRGQPGAGFAGPEYRPLVDLSELLGFATGEPGRDYLVRPVGRATAEAAGVGAVWSLGPADAFLVGDGSALWLIATDGAATFLADDVTAAAVNPAAFGAGGVDGATLLADRRAPRSARPGTADVQVFFAAPGPDCTATRPVTRSVPLPRVAEGAVRALVAGPTAQEAAEGATSAFSAATAGLVEDLSLRDGVVTVDLEALDGVLPRPASACEADRLRAQLTDTLLQFAEIREVRYLVDGQEGVFERFLTPRRAATPSQRRLPAGAQDPGPTGPPPAETAPAGRGEGGEY